MESMLNVLNAKMRESRTNIALKPLVLKGIFPFFGDADAGFCTEGFDRFFDHRHDVFDCPNKDASEFRQICESPGCPGLKDRVFETLAI
jgi:hypothetical protein